MYDEIRNLFKEKFDFLEPINEKSFERLVQSSYTSKMSKGQIMQRDNTQCIGVPFVVKGSLKLFRTAENGREMTIYKVHEGELCLLAALCVLTDKEYDFTVVAERDTELIIVNSNDFKNIIEKSPQLNKYILAVLADKLIYTLTLHEKIHLTSVDDKLYNYLMENAENGVLHTTHSEIAQDLGTSRVVISRAVGKMRDEGLIETSRNLIKIK